MGSTPFIDCLTKRRAVWAVMMAALAAAAAGNGLPALAAEGPDLVSALNAARTAGCGGRPGVKAPVRENAQLSQAAAHVVASGPYQDALAAAGYRATRSALIRLTSDSGARLIADYVASNFCGYLIDPQLREIGLHQQMRETRIILAAPFAPPDAQASGAVAERVLELVNQARSQARACGNTRFPATSRLRLSAMLDDISFAHAADMAQHSYLSHEGRDGSTLADRATRAGYSWHWVGENIASGQSTPEEVVQGWIMSPPHCANLMTPRFTEMGVAFAVDKASEAGIYWVQFFGTPR